MGCGASSKEKKYEPEAGKTDGSTAADASAKTEPGPPAPQSAPQAAADPVAPQSAADAPAATPAEAAPPVAEEAKASAAEEAPTPAAAEAAPAATEESKAAADSAPTEAAVAEEEEEEDDDDGCEELEEQSEEAMQNMRRSRKAIAAETWTSDADWTPPVHPKAPEQYEQIKAAVSQSFMFACLTPDQMGVLIDAFDGPQTFAAGDEVIKQGETVTSGMPGLFVLSNGKLDVFKKSADEEHPGTKVADYDKIGQSFGELALLYNCPRAATVRAVEECTLWSIDRDTFNHCVKGAQLEQRRRNEEFLASVELLKDLTVVERAKIADIIKMRTYKDGENIITQGDVGKEFFMLEKGAAKATVEGAVVKEYVPGNYFGELALLNKEPRKASVVAGADNTVCQWLDADSFKRLLGNLSDILEERAKKEYAGVGADGTPAPAS